MVLATVKLVAESPWFVQGDADAKPRPAPSVTKIKETETAATEPARMAPHEAAGLDLKRAASSN